MPNVSQELRAGVTGLGSVDGVEVVGDPVWFSSPGHWGIHCHLRANINPDGELPEISAWYFLVEDTYPWGEIHLFPAKDDGIQQTFPHQRFNAEGEPGHPWRTGKICTQTPQRSILRQQVDDEPYVPKARLAWHALRALEWLEDASKGSLSIDGEPFEIPDFPIRRRDESFCYAEDESTSKEWQAVKHTSGLIQMRGLSTSRRRILAVSFLTDREDPLALREWGHVIGEVAPSKPASIWIRLEEPPVIAPWQAPSTWQELRGACQAQGVDLDAQLRPLLNLIRDGESHLLVFGFPIPPIIGEPPSILHWQALHLPTLSRGDRHAKGFRANELGFWRRDRFELLSDKTEVGWVKSENWHTAQMATRGRLPAEVRAHQTLLIGGGALGSPLAEMLVRGGLHRLTIVDPDTFESGNLVRHTLGLDHLDSGKADALAARLNLASPHAQVSAISTPFPECGEQDPDAIQACTLIIDSTADDSVLQHIAAWPWQGERLFVSVSIGAFARRLFFFAMRSTRFDPAEFHDRVGSYLHEERDQLKERSFPREGIGCWDSVFPARADDLWLLSSAAVKELERYCLSGRDDPLLTIYEQGQDNDFFAGLQRIEG